MLHVPPSVLSQASSCAGVAYTTCEWLQALPFEVRSIWRNPDFPLHLRCIYILARYTGLLGQVLHLAAFNYLSSITTVSRSMCNFYWFSQQYIGAFGLVMLQILLSKHVYALWKHDFWIGVLLCAFLVLDCVACVVFTTMAMGEMTYLQQSCFVVESIPRQVLCLCGTETFVQICLWSLALVNCENGVTFVLACAVPVWIIIDGVWTRLGTQMNTLSYSAFPIFLAITTSMTCRTIINLHQASERRSQEIPSDDEEGPILTSVYFD